MAQIDSIRLNKHSICVQGRQQVAAPMDDEVAVMSIQGGKYHCLNSTSSVIWGQIEKPRQVADVCRVLQDEFDVEPQQCEAEVLAHLQDLVSENLVEVLDAAPA